MQGPRGTRDLYPAEAARRRWITERWREVAVRHGFEEVDGPTFEESDLYAVKSGEGILGELFQAYSGKSHDEVERVKATGRAPYAMRPEFTPTLARMYAARAAGLPKPCKWFQIGPFFRAERPQRGRLREFLQWNCDVLGLDVPVEKRNAEDAEAEAEVAEAKARMDGELLCLLIDYFSHVGLSSQEVIIRFNSRSIVERKMNALGIPDDKRPRVLALIDAASKLESGELSARLRDLGLDEGAFSRLFGRPLVGESIIMGDSDVLGFVGDIVAAVPFNDCADWLRYDPGIVRGLAYYTGTVFEVIAEGERAVAGGGRYDNLVELFGGPPTPAVGFAMGDVVLANLLQDKGLMPSDAELMGLVGQTPDVFVLSNGDEGAEKQVRPLVAALRRGSRAPQDSGLKSQSPGLNPQAPGPKPQAFLHVRHSYKATKNVGKLLKEAAQQGARFAVIVESEAEATVKDLRTGEQWPDRVPIGDVGRRIAERVRGG